MDYHLLYRWSLQLIYKLNLYQPRNKEIFCRGWFSQNLNLFELLVFLFIIFLFK